MPRAPSAETIAQIGFHGGEKRFVDSAAAMYLESAHPTGWRGNNNIAESIFTQMAREEHTVPG